MPPAKNEVENAESLVNSLIFSMINYFVLLLVVLIMENWITLIVCGCEILLCIAVTYSRLSIARSAALIGPILCCTMMLYCYVVSFFTLPTVPALLLQIAVGCLSLAYMANSNELMMLLQLVLFLVPYSPVYTVQMHYGLLPVVACCLMYNMYYVASVKLEYKFAFNHAFMMCVPLFRLDFVIMLIYMAVSLFANVYLFMNGRAREVDSDDEDEEDVENLTPIIVTQEETKKTVTIQETTSAPLTTRPRLHSSVNFPTSSNKSAIKVPMRTYATHATFPTPAPIPEPKVNNQQVQGSSSLLSRYLPS